MYFSMWTSLVVLIFSVNNAFAQNRRDSPLDGDVDINNQLVLSPLFYPRFLRDRQGYIQSPCVRRSLTFCEEAYGYPGRAMRKLFPQLSTVSVRLGVNLTSLLTDESEGLEEPPEDPSYYIQSGRSRRVLKRSTIRCGCGERRVIRPEAAVTRDGQWRYLASTGESTGAESQLGSAPSAEYASIPVGDPSPVGLYSKRRSPPVIVAEMCSATPSGLSKNWRQEKKRRRQLYSGITLSAYGVGESRERLVKDTFVLPTCCQCI